MLYLIQAIRKNIEELNNNVNAITTEMTEKVDRDNVNIIVHEKYEVSVITLLMTVCLYVLS